MAKFKIGDRVRVIADHSKGQEKSKHIGKCFTIYDYLNSYDSPHSKDTYGLKNDFIWFDNELELIKPKFDIENYHGSCAMHVTTEEQDTIFRNYLHSLDKRWRNGDSYDTITHFDKYREHTVYHFNENTFENTIHAKLLYSPAPTILEFDDFDWSDFTMKKEFTKAGLKNGDIIKRRDDSVEIFISDLNVFVSDNGDYSEIKCINDDLTSNVSPTRDIVAVRRIACNYANPFQTFTYEYGTLVYERKEVEEMTLEEVCKALGKEIKIVKK